MDLDNRRRVLGRVHLTQFFYANKTVWCQRPMLLQGILTLTTSLLQSQLPCVTRVLSGIEWNLRPSDNFRAKAKHLTGISLKGPSVLWAIFTHLTGNFLLQFTFKCTGSLFLWLLFNLRGFSSISLNLGHCSDSTKINSTNSSGNSVDITSFHLFGSFHPNSLQFS